MVSGLGKVSAPGRPESESEEMQGHFKGKGYLKGQPVNENHSAQLHSGLLNVSASSTTDSSSMDSSHQQQSNVQASSSTPQIRSRITVVCAECKRLKLKCDRRTPCGSCTKRDTVARCIYSPAAAEKVDLHSLNNRLIQTEACLALITQGKTPPPFQSSYPLAQVPLSSTHSNVHPDSHQHKTTVTTVSSISISKHDLTTIWLTHCQLNLNVQPEMHNLHKFESLSEEDDSSYIKLEPSPVDMFYLSVPGSEETTIIDENFHIGGLSRCPQIELPPLSIYYPSALSASPKQQPSTYTYPTAPNAFPMHEGQSSNSYAYPPFSHSSQQAQYKFPPSTHTPHTPPTSLSNDGASSTYHMKPSLTPALLTLLPSLPMRENLIKRAREAYPQLALWVPWDRVMELAGLEDKEREKKKEAEMEKKKKAELARAIFFNGRVDSVSSSSRQPQTPAPVKTLPLFAILCYLLALGALENGSGRDTTVNPAFLYALAGQAMGLWELENKQHRASEEEVQEDKDRARDEIYHYVGCLLQIMFLTREGSGKGKQGLEAAFPLIGKLVSTARLLGLAQGTDDSMGSTRLSKVIDTEKKELKKMLWWELMFYDTFVSDALNQTALVSLHSYSTRMPLCGLPSASMSSSSRGSRVDDPDGEGDDEQEDDDDDDYSDDGDDRASQQIPKKRRHGLTKHSNSIKARGAGKDRSDASREQSTDEIFFSVRCRLTQLTQSIKHQFSHPGCECCGTGYTLDHACKLEGDIRSWIAELPPSLKLDSLPPNNEVKPTAGNAILAVELAIMANRLIIAIYLPFLRPRSSSHTNSSSYSCRSWSPPSRATLDAAQGVISAARVLYRLVRGCGSEAGMMMRDFYSLNKAVLDAVVICAHAGIVNSGVKARSDKRVLEDVAIGLEILTTSGNCDQGEMGKIAGALKRKLAGLGGAEVEENLRTDENMLKRKHDQVEVMSEGKSQRDVEGSMGGDTDRMLLDFETPHPQNMDGITEVGQVLQPISPIRQPQQQFFHQHASRHPSPQRRDSFSTRTKDCDKDKDRKHPKKSGKYPSFGIRVRREPPPFTKRTDTANTGSVPPESNEKSVSPLLGSQAQQLIITDSIVPPATTQEDRPRSSSITQDQRTRNPTQPPVNFTLPFGGPNHSHLASQQNNFNAHEMQQQQQEQQQTQVFTSSPVTYNPSQQPSRAGSFDHHRGYEQLHNNSFDGSSTDSYATASSPYSGAPLSSAGSPYASTNVGPPASAPASSHHPSPPIFGPPLSASPQMFYRIPGGYDSSYDRHSQQQQQQSVPNLMSMDTSTTLNEQQGAGASSVPTTPVYEKPMHSLYDMKPAMDGLGLGLGQMEQYQVGSRDVGQQQQEHLMSSLNVGITPQTWAPVHPLAPPHYQWGGVYYG